MVSWTMPTNDVIAEALEESLQRAYELHENHKPRACADHLVKVIDVLSEHLQFVSLGTFLTLLDLKRIPVEAVTGVVMFCFYNHEKIHGYDDFLDRARHVHPETSKHLDRFDPRLGADNKRAREAHQTLMSLIGR